MQTVQGVAVCVVDRLESVDCFLALSGGLGESRLLLAGNPVLLGDSRPAARLRCVFC